MSGSNKDYTQNRFREEIYAHMRDELESRQKDLCKGLNMTVTDPMEREARFVRMVLIECFVGATTWSDMMRIGEALSKLKRIEQEMHAEWQHLNSSGNAYGAASMDTAASQQSTAAASLNETPPATASAVARR